MSPSLKDPDPATISEWIGWGSRILQGHLEDPGEESRFLMEALLGSRTSVWTRGSSLLPPEQAHQFRSWIDRRRDREPFHLIVGSVEFFGNRFVLRPGVLIPRPETELLVQRCIEGLEGRGESGSPLRILDLGTGSGAIVLSLVLAISGSTGVGVEREMPAMDVFLENRRRLGIERRVAAVRGSWGDMLSRRPSFDCIVSNPPYIPTGIIPGLAPEIRLFEPWSALDGGEDGLREYREILSFAPMLLKRGGLLAVEIAPGLARSDLFSGASPEAAGLERPEILKDLSGHDRVVTWVKKG